MDVREREGGRAQPIGNAAGALDYVGLQLTLNLEEERFEASLEVRSSEPFSELRVFDPDRRLILEQRDLGVSRLGADEVRVQLQPQAKDAALAPGSYEVEAVTADGKRFFGVLDLVPDFVDSPLLQETASTPLDPDDVTIAWESVPDAVGYVVEFERAESIVLRIELASSQTQVRVPAGVLEGGATYEVTVQARSPHGHVTESELKIETAQRL